MGPKTVDLDKITDVNTLKVMAYDQMAAKQQAETNLQNINTRIAQIMTGVPATPKVPAAPSAPVLDAPAASDTAPTSAPAAESEPTA